IDELGRVSQATLLADKYKDDNGNSIKLFDKMAVKPLEVRFSDEKMNSEAFKIKYIASSNFVTVGEKSAKLTLTQNLSDVTIIKELEFHNDGHYTLKIKTSKAINYFVTTGHRPVGDTSNYILAKGALIKGADGIITTIEDGDAIGDEIFQSAKFASAFDRYYVSMFYNLEKGLNVTVAKDREDDPLIFVQGSTNFETKGFIGSKNYESLKRVDPILTDVIEYGWFTFLSKPFFTIIIWIHSFVGNWGWAIILFTLLVKLILFPLSYKGMMSMQKLKDLAPKMKDIKEKYGKDPQKMNMKMMEMYKKHGANPMGGCLPLLLQIPVFFALYRVLLNADELQGADWILWITDMSKMDPYFVLPILMGASMYFQQKITPTNITDPLQEKIFKFFPVIMTIFFVTFPSGLVLYWLTNNVLSIAQQYYINIAYAKHKDALAIAHKKKEESQK
nr:membrane protein insertase YidC [Sulfurovaceae bacterium]